MELLKKIYHILIKRDIKTWFYTRQFKQFGHSSVLYRPLYIRGKRYINIGKNSTILNNVRIQVYNDLTGLRSEIKIGDNCYIGYNNTFLVGGDIVLENGVLMASNILISSENHSFDPENRNYYQTQQLQCESVHVGEGTWIGENVCIMSGVTIGKKCVIGAGSVVTRSIPDYCLAAGTPARILKKYNFKNHVWEKQ